jgi:hypothetical protein
MKYEKHPKYDFEIKEISRFDSTVLIQTYHYSKIMPKLTKHFLGCFLKDELVGVLTLGWGTKPRHTFNKIFPDVGILEKNKETGNFKHDINDWYYEIGKMCMKPEMPPTSESQMLSEVVKWIKKNTNVKFLYTWADGIMGKPGFVYQAANFLYGDFIWTQIYISDKGEKIHPRSSKRLCTENYEFKVKREPDFFKGKKIDKKTGHARIYWLTQDFLDHKGITKVYGKQFRYILPLNKKARKLLKKSKVEWNLNYPKGNDLIWNKSTKEGKKQLEGMPYIDSNMTEYNAKNVNAHMGTLEAFI